MSSGAEAAAVRASFIDLVLKGPLISRFTKSFASMTFVHGVSLHLFMHCLKKTCSHNVFMHCLTMFKHVFQALRGPPHRHARQGGVLFADKRLHGCLVFSVASPCDVQQ